MEKGAAGFRADKKIQVQHFDQQDIDEWNKTVNTS